VNSNPPIVQAPELDTPQETQQEPAESSESSQESPDTSPDVESVLEEIDRQFQDGIVVQEGIEELVVIEELLEDPELTEPENVMRLRSLPRRMCWPAYMLLWQEGVTCILYTL